MFTKRMFQAPCRDALNHAGGAIWVEYEPTCFQNYAVSAQSLQNMQGKILYVHLGYVLELLVYVCTLIICESCVLLGQYALCARNSQIYRRT